MTARDLAIATIGARCFAAIEKNAGEAAAIRAAWHRVLADQHQERARWQRVTSSRDRTARGGELP